MLRVPSSGHAVQQPLLSNQPAMGKDGGEGAFTCTHEVCQVVARLSGQYCPQQTRAKAKGIRAYVVVEKGSRSSPRKLARLLDDKNYIHNM